MVSLVCRSFLLEDRCRFLSNFSLATADMDIPGEYLMPKAMPYYVRIARFMPRVEIVQRHHSTVRRLYIQGDNGKASIMQSIQPLIQSKPGSVESTFSVIFSNLSVMFQ